MATRAGGGGDPSHEQLEIIIDLGDCSDGGAGRFDAVALLDGDGRGNPLDGDGPGLVHPVEKLPRVGAECFDIAPLSLRINGVKGEARFSGTTRACDYDQGPGREIEINAFEVVLSDALKAYPWRICHLGERRKYREKRGRVTPFLFQFFPRKISALLCGEAPAGA